MTSMKDIAERVGVSITTVSHALNRTRAVAPETRRKIEEAIRELGFYKNVHARRLVRGRSDFLGLIVSDIGNPFFPEVIKSFESAALEGGFDLLLCNTNYEPRRTELAVRKMIENKVRGVAVMTSEFAPALAKDLLAHHVPVVFLDVGPVQVLTSNIRVNYTQGIFEAIDHLYELGHTEIAFIAGPQNLRSAVTRRKAFLDALQKRSLASHRTVEGNHKVDGGMTAVGTLLRKRPLPTAILCSNDLTAIGAIRALHEARLKVPEDVSVIGFDDIDFAQMAHPPLTTINLPRDRLGSLALEALRKLFGPPRRAKGDEFVIETHLVKRHSTAPVRQDYSHPLSQSAAAGS
jgi:DNA-binding LacI/PurR family transcriptional regulator